MRLFAQLRVTAFKDEIPVGTEAGGREYGDRGDPSTTHFVCAQDERVFYSDALGTEASASERCRGRYKIKKLAMAARKHLSFRAPTRDDVMDEIPVGTGGSAKHDPGE